MAKYAAYGSELQMGDSDYLPVFATVAQLKTINGPDKTPDVEDVTTHDSPSTGPDNVPYEEVIKTIMRTGEVSADVVWDPDDATHTAIQTAIDERGPRLFQIIEASGHTSEFHAFVMGATFERDVAGALTGSITLKQTGAPVEFWTPAP